MSVETHTLFVNVTVKTDWSIHVRSLALAHVLEVMPAFAGVISLRRERQTTVSKILIEFISKRLYFDSASQMRTSLMQKPEKRGVQQESHVLIGSHVMVLHRDRGVVVVEVGCCVGVVWGDVVRWVVWAGEGRGGEERWR